MRTHGSSDYAADPNAIEAAHQACQLIRTNTVWASIGKTLQGLWPMTQQEALQIIGWAHHSYPGCDPQ